MIMIVSSNVYNIYVFVTYIYVVYIVKCIYITNEAFRHFNVGSARFEFLTEMSLAEHCRPISKRSPVSLHCYNVTNTACCGGALPPGPITRPQSGAQTLITFTNAKRPTKSPTTTILNSQSSIHYSLVIITIPCRHVACSMYITLHFQFVPSITCLFRFSLRIYGLNLFNFILFQSVWLIVNLGFYQRLVLFFLYFYQSLLLLKTFCLSVI